jgi:surfeit locus 1 family protein
MSAGLSGRLPALAMLAASLVALAILVSLGMWQLDRRAEKGAFLERLRSEARSTPRAGWAEAGDLARVSVTGGFIPGRDAFVRVTMQPFGLALYVVTPFRLDDGRIILVNRGAVKANADGGPRAIEPPPAGAVTLTGFRRVPEQRWRFSGRDEPGKLIFAVRDPALIGAALGIPADASAVLELERAPGAVADPSRPLATDAAELIARIPDNHLNYALTWFGLALTLIGVMAAFLLRRRGAAE